MPKKPKLILLIGLVVLAIPPFMLGQVMIYFNHTPLEIVSIFAKLTKLNFLIIITATVTSYYILKFHKIGWYMLNVLCFLILINNTIIFFNSNLHNPFWIISGSLLILTFNLTLWQSKNRSVFFNPKLHWWRPAKRYNKSVKVVLSSNGNCFEEKTLDISKSGALLTDSTKIKIGSELKMKLYLDNISIVKGTCKVVRKGIGKNGMLGAGIQFIDLHGLSEKILNKHLVDICA